MLDEKFSQYEFAENVSYCDLTEAIEKEEKGKIILEFCKTNKDKCAQFLFAYGLKKGII